MPKFRAFTPDDIPAAQSLSAAFGWPHRIEDWHVMAALGHGIVAEIEGTPVGTGFFWPYGEEVASLGMILVDPEHQQRGIGHQIMQRVMDAAGPRTLALNATKAGEKLYARLGFEPVGLVRQIQGVLLDRRLSQDHSFAPLTEALIEDVISYDFQAMGIDRSAVLRRLAAEGRGLVQLENGAVTGFGIIRRFGRGQLVGPVVGETPELRRSLTKALVASATGFLRIDVCQEEPALSRFLAQSGLCEVDQVITMVCHPKSGPRWRPGTAQTCVVSQAFG